MESDLETKPIHNKCNMSEQRYKDIDSFSKKVLDKHGKLISSTIVKRPGMSYDSIELLFILDDLNNIIFDQHVLDMKVSSSEFAYTSTLPIKCDFLLASEIWRGFKARDKATLQILRESLVVKDNGFFLPIQDLLVKGKVRPSKESVQIYFVKAERSIKTSGQHVSKAIIDLYWAVTDSAHAAVMVGGHTPPSPKDLAGTVKKELVTRNLVHKRCGEIVERFYIAAKQIMHRERFDISGKEFDSFLADANFFIKEMDYFVKSHMK